jgi:hypothetical protein
MKVPKSRVWCIPININSKKFEQNPRDSRNFTKMQGNIRKLKEFREFLQNLADVDGLLEILKDFGDF